MEKREKHGGWEIVLKGIWIGGTMTVPGVSGGSMAMILGIYDRLIACVSLLFKKPKESLSFLLCFGAGGAVGAALFSGGITWLLTTAAAVPLRCFFLGAVAGSIPMICKKAGTVRPEPGIILYPLIGIMAVVILSLLPSGLFEGGESGPGAILMQLAGGLLLAVGLVLPGISLSQLLYMLGSYERIMENISSFNLLPLLPMGAGVLGGTFLTANILEGLIRRHPQPTFLIILGFMLGSLPELLPNISGGMELLASAVAAGLGFLALYNLSARE